MRDIIRKTIREFLNESTDTDNKTGIDIVYKQHPELNDIGTKEQYYQYLNTVFPNTKVKGIFYHASPNKFTEFKDPSSSGLSHIWFSEKPMTDQFGSNMYSVLLNVTNPLSEKDSDYNKEIRGYENPINPDWATNYHITGELPKFKYDGTVRKSRVSDGWDITVRNPKQIHMLGSKQDIEGFKNFVKK